EPEAGKFAQLALSRWNEEQPPRMAARSEGSAAADRDGAVLLGALTMVGADPSEERRSLLVPFLTRPDFEVKSEAAVGLHGLRDLPKAPLLDVVQCDPDALRALPGVAEPLTAAEMCEVLRSIPPGRKHEPHLHAWLVAQAQSLGDALWGLLFGHAVPAGPAGAVVRDAAPEERLWAVLAE